ncbi:MAG: hypothetical protein ACYC0Q_09240 [Eubacteriales bacterium]
MDGLEVYLGPGNPLDLYDRVTRGGVEAAGKRRRPICTCGPTRANWGNRGRRCPAGLEELQA